MRKISLGSLPKNIGARRKTTVPLNKLAQAPTVRGGVSPVAPYTSVVRTQSKAAQRTLIIRGTAGGTVDAPYSFGDAYVTIGRTLAPVPVNTIFSGSFGSGTTAAGVTNQVLTAITVGNPFHIRQLRVEVSATSVFTTSNARILYGDYDGSVNQQKIQFSQAKRPSNYDQTQLLFDNFNVTFDAFVAFVITQTTITTEYMEWDFELDMVATIYSMQA